MGFLTLLFSAKSFTSKLFDSGGLSPSPVAFVLHPLLNNLLTSYADVCSGECNDNNDDKYWNADGNTDPQLSRSFVTS